MPPRPGGTRRTAGTAAIGAVVRLPVTAVEAGLDPSSTRGRV
ncbi:hypothetical protein [Nocardia bovistercoris]|nr:hypothetical protein [Nocardia bovistercoris]